MSKSHNKKRNLGLVYELLLKEIAISAMNQNESRSNIALEILKKHFKNGSELLKEFKLINSLAKTKFVNQNVIGSILNESKNAIRKIDANKLEREKTNLIHDINIGLGYEFFDGHLPEYKNYATIQVLFNNWRNKNPDLGIMAKFEQYLCEEILPYKNKDIENTSESKKQMEALDGGSKRLVLKLMTKKIKEKYDGILNEQQKSLLKEYIFDYQRENKKDQLHTKMFSIRENTLKLIEKYNKSNTSDFLKNKLNNCKDLIFKDNLEVINDELISRYLGLIKLQEELSSED